MIPMGSKLKELRLSKGVTQKQIAEYLNIAPNSWQQFEYNKVNPSYENLVKLCGYFNVTSDYLLGLSNDPTRH